MKKFITIIAALTLVSCKLATNTKTDITVNKEDIINVYGVQHTDNCEPYTQFRTSTFDYDGHTWRIWRVIKNNINICHDPNCACMHKYEVKESSYTPAYDKSDTSSIFDDISW